MICIISGQWKCQVITKSSVYKISFFLIYYLHQNKQVSFVKVYERTADAAISYVGDREEVIKALRAFSYEKADVPQEVIANSGRKLNADYQEKLITKVAEQRIDLADRHTV